MLFKDEEMQMKMLKKMMFVFTFLFLLAGVCYADNINLKSANSDSKDINIYYETTFCYRAVLEKEPTCTENGIEFLLAEKIITQDCRSDAKTTGSLKYSIEKLQPLNCSKLEVIVKDKSETTSPPIKLTKEQLEPAVFPKSSLPTTVLGRQPK